MEEKKYLEINNKKMAFIDEGEGDPILFLHGNPTSSYLWRNIIPHVQGMGRIIAPDLIGMGDSEKLDEVNSSSYSFLEHADYLYGLIEQLGLEKVTLVIHDWGSALGFHWARLHPDKIKSIIYMEAIIGPIDSWDDWPENARNIFQAFRSEAGEELVLEKNIFVERILGGDGKLKEEDMNVYLKPFFKPGEDRRPTLTWPRQIPIAGEPKEVVEIAKDYEEFMKTSNFPKLFINAEPGSILVGKTRERCRSWKNQKEVTVQGGHFIQEISPNEIGSAIKSFLSELE